MNDLPAVYGQRNPSWGNRRLGYPGVVADSSTIHNVGCYVTSMAMLSTYFGKAVTPPMMNDWFVTHQRFVQGNLLTDVALNDHTPGCAFAEVIRYSDVPADLVKLRELLDDAANGVILEVDSDPPRLGVQSHFCVAVDVEGETVTIADPWTGRVEDLAIHYTRPELNIGVRQAIQKYVIYRGVPIAAQPPPVITVPVKPTPESETTFDFRLKMIYEDLLLQTPLYRKTKRGKSTRYAAIGQADIDDAIARAK